MASQPGLVILQMPTAAGGRAWRRFRAPVEILAAPRLDQVRSVIDRVEEAALRGLWAAGFVCYEAGPAFEPALAAHHGCPLPLAWFGLYDQPEPLAELPPPGVPVTLTPWRPAADRATYDAGVARIHGLIASGDTYQVNYTIRLHAAFDGESWSLARRLWRAQGGAHQAYLDLGDDVIVSASPELFLRLDGTTLTSRPMKGTAPRGCTLEQDRRLAADLAASVKDRAENLMITDMVRNDLGRIARVGSVAVPVLFGVERYVTVWQMTSTVTAESDAPLGDILAALFPCASITGAPKIRTSTIIRELEPTPRGIYTGAIGFIGPGRQAELNVAIRTVHLDRRRGTAEFGVGGGVVWDSTPAGEYAECLAKSEVLSRERPDFELLETLLWRPGEGYWLLERHLARLAASAEYFGLELQRRGVEAALAEVAGDGPQRVRLLVAEDGTARVEATPCDPTAADRVWRVALAAAPVDPGDRFLYHKTTYRAVYDRARASRPNVDDVLLWNERGEVTETTIANVAVEREGRRVTPPVECGLLAGTFRAELLNRGELTERVVRVDELAPGEPLWLLNSVRGWVRATLAPG